MSDATHVAKVIDYLVTTCGASASLGAAASPVTVVDGEPVTADVEAQERLLFIGYDLTTPKTPVAQATQNWPVIDHARTVDEDGEVTCTAEFWTGDPTMKTARDGCVAIVEAVADLLKGAPGGTGPGDTTMGGLAYWSRLAQFTWSQDRSDSGPGVICVFKVIYRSRLTS